MTWHPNRRRENYRTGFNRWIAAEKQPKQKCPISSRNITQLTTQLDQKVQCKLTAFDGKINLSSCLISSERPVSNQTQLRAKILAHCNVRRRFPQHRQSLFRQFHRQIMQSLTHLTFSVCPCYPSFCRTFCPIIFPYQVILYWHTY